MDIKIERPRITCAVSGRPFVAGETVYSALLRDGGQIRRHDVAADAWSGPPPATLAWWRAAHTPGPAREEVAPVDVLLDLLEGLEGRDDDAALRYLLALELVRRRVLRVVEAAGPASAAVPLQLTCRRRDSTYTVATVPPDRLVDPGLESRLAALLWPAEAA